MTVIVEGALRFEFGPSWQQVEKYDEHRLYREGIRRLEEEFECEKCSKTGGVGTKAVDIVGRHGGQLYLIEVKDFRKYRIESKGRLKTGELATEVALKVRDTLAGLVGAIHNGAIHRDATNWKALVEPIFKSTPKVVLWLEQDLPAETLRPRGMPLADQLKGRLDWLKPYVVIARQSSPVLPDLDVTYHARSRV